MTTSIQRRRGTTAQHGAFTGAVGEVTVDTDKEVLVVHDGAQVGGYPQMRENGSNSALSLGSAATPSLKFAGDPNTGIYSPGADQLAISTAGSGRLFVDASGNVGAGLSNQSSYYTDWNQLVVGAASGSKGITIATGSSDAGTLAFADGTSLADRYRGYIQYTHASDALSFATSATERLRITSAGLVGVGTSAPVAKFQINVQDGFRFDVGANAYSYMQFGSAGAGEGSAEIGFERTSGKIFLKNTIGGSLTTFLTGDGSGRVGIGTTTASARCQISTTNVGDVNLALSGPTADNNWGGYLTLNSNNGTTVTAGIQASTSGMFFYYGGSERFRCDSSGRLLVGTSSARSNFVLGTPTVQFETATSTFNQGLSIINNGGTVGYDPTLTLGATRGTSVGSNTAIPSAGYGLGRIDFAGADGTTLLTGARIHGVSDGVWGTNDGPSALVFSVTRDSQSSPTEALRITNGGETRIFCVTTAQGLIINHSDTARNVYAFYEGRYSATDNTGSTGTRSYIVYTSGDVRNVNNSYGAISDIKLKENIVDANSQWDDLKALQVRNYNFKEGQTHTQIGLVAQEVELVSPGLVSESPDRDEEGNDLGTVTKSVNYSVLYMKAVKALQEAMERIETLEAKVAALESA